MSEGRLRRMRGTAMRQRRPASSTRDDRRRPLPAKHGHAARPQATREYQSDTSSKQRPRSSISPRSGAGSPRPPPVLIDNRSLHISYLAYKEDCVGVPRTPTDRAELRDHLREYAARLSVRDNLEAFAHALDVQSDPGMKAYYYLIELDAESKQVGIKGYRSADMTRAMNDYRTAERAAFEGGGHPDTVLVSAESLTALKRSYPNYYLDTVNFVKELLEATR